LRTEFSKNNLAIFKNSVGFEHGIHYLLCLKKFNMHFDVIITDLTHFDRAIEIAKNYQLSNVVFKTPSILYNGSAKILFYLWCRIFTTICYFVKYCPYFIEYRMIQILTRINIIVGKCISFSKQLLSKYNLIILSANIRSGSADKKNYNYSELFCKKVDVKRIFIIKETFQFYRSFIPFPFILDYPLNNNELLFATHQDICNQDYDNINMYYYGIPLLVAKTNQIDKSRIVTAEKKKIIFLTSSLTKSIKNWNLYLEEIDNLFFYAAKSFPEYEFFIRLHSKANKLKYLSRINKSILKNIKILNNNEILIDQCSTADIVFAAPSTALLVLILNQIPVIHYQSDLFSDEDLITSGYSINFNNKSELSQLLQKSKKEINSLLKPVDELEKYIYGEIGKQNFFESLGKELFSKSN